MASKAWETWDALGQLLRDQSHPLGDHLALEHRFATTRIPADERHTLRQVLAASRHALECAWLDRLGGADSGLRPILQNGALRAIDVARVSEATLDALAALPPHEDAPLLTHLVVRDRGATVLEWVARTSQLPRFDALALFGGDDGDSAASVLLQCSSTLRELTMVRCELSDEGAIAVASSDALGSLQRLDLSGNFLADPGARALADSSWSELHTLVLSDNEISDAGATSLAHATWPRLRELHLQRNFIETKGVRALLNSPKRSCMRTLLLASNPLTDTAELAHRRWRAP